MKLASVFCLLAHAHATVGASKPSNHHRHGHRKSVGEQATLDDKGYQDVAMTQNNTEMATYVRRVLREVHLQMKSDGEQDFNGFVPWFSGVKASQNFAILVQELQKADWAEATAGMSRGASSKMLISRHIEKSALPTPPLALGPLPSRHIVESSLPAAPQVEEPVPVADVESTDLPPALPLSQKMHIHRKIKESTLPAAPQVGWHAEQAERAGDAEGISAKLRLNDAQDEGPTSAQVQPTDAQDKKNPSFELKQHHSKATVEQRSGTEKKRSRSRHHSHERRRAHRSHRF